MDLDRKDLQIILQAIYNHRDSVLAERDTPARTEHLVKVAHIIDEVLKEGEKV